MKRVVVIAVLVALTGLITSCDSDREPVGPPNPTPGVVSIPVGGTLTVQPYGLEIEFDTVLEDSRCPIGAMCYWGGMAKIKLYVASSDSDRQALIFQIDPAQPAPDTSRYLTTDAGRFRIDMRGLTPIPSVFEPHDYEDNIVTLSVTPYQAADSVVGAVVPSRLPISGLLGEGYGLASVRVDGSLLKAKVTYNACTNHTLTLFMSPVLFAESDPVQANLYLHHSSDGIPCRSIITEDVAFDLQPMLDLHLQYYGYEADILLNVYSQTDSVWVLKEQVMYEPPEYHTLTLPMAIGNYWIYADTVWFNGVPTASLDTITVINQVSDSLGNWWVLSKRMLTLGDRIMIKGDSIYTLQYGWLVDYAEREYIPPVDTPVTYNMLLQGDLMYERTAYETDTVIITPAGTFDNLYRYDSPYYFCSSPLKQFFKPGIGFVYQDQSFCNLVPTNNYMRRTWLVEYRVQ